MSYEVFDSEFKGRTGVCDAANTENLQRDRLEGENVKRIILILLFPFIIPLWLLGWTLFWTGLKRSQIPVANTCSGATARLLAMEAEE